MSNNTKIPVGDNPFTKQEAGTHYVNMAIQPITFATVNQYDPCAFSILKYVSRHRSKNGNQDLKKARHCVELRVALLDNIERDAPLGGIPMTEYIARNNIETRDAEVLVALDRWVNSDDVDQTEHAGLITDLIDELIALS